MTEKEFEKYTVPFLVESIIDKTLVRVTSYDLEHFYGEMHFSGSVMKENSNYPKGYYSDTWRLSVFIKYEEFTDKMIKSIRRINEEKK